MRTIWSVLLLAFALCFGVSSSCFAQRPPFTRVSYLSVAWQGDEPEIADVGIMIFFDEGLFGIPLLVTYWMSEEGINVGTWKYDPTVTRWTATMPFAIRYRSYDGDAINLTEPPIGLLFGTIIDVYENRWTMLGMDNWTALGAENAHPNGTNVATPLSVRGTPSEEHWAIRRSVAHEAEEDVAPEPTDLTLTKRSSMTDTRCGGRTERGLAAAVGLGGLVVGLAGLLVAGRKTRSQ